MRTISVIIPVLNEVHFLRNTIEQVLKAASCPEVLEVLVIDAGSSDNTLDSISDLNVQIFSDPKFRGQKHLSLNKGIEKAQGQILLFLDADTIVPDAFDQDIRRALKDNVVAGAFDMRFSEGGWHYQWLTWLNSLRYRIDKAYFGDQGIFCLASTARKVNGFPNKNLMESAYFCRVLKKQGKLKLVNAKVYTSPRRFQENGFWKMAFFDALMWVRFTLHLEVDRFGAAYWEHNFKSLSGAH